MSTTDDTADVISFYVAQRQAFLAELNSTSTTPEPTPDVPPAPEPQPVTYPHEIAYDYRDEAGNLLFQAVRKQLSPGEKTFFQRHPDGQGGWVNNLQDTRRVLYRLPELLAADPTLTVYVPEGEKDVNNLVTLGCVATTNAGGAQHQWTPEYAASLKGRNVVLLADNDQPGEDHVQQVAETLHGTAATIRILRFCDMPPKSDVSDWLAAGGDVISLSELAAKAPLWEPKAVAVDIFANQQAHADAGSRPTPTPKPKPKRDAPQPKPTENDPVQRLLRKLNKTKRTSTGWVAQCPAHGDRHPSLSVRYGQDRCALIKCHAGCSNEQICTALNITLADLFDRPIDSDCTWESTWESTIDPDTFLAAEEDDEAEDESHQFEPRQLDLAGIPEGVRTLANYYATALVEPPSIHHVMMAVYTVAAVTGKRVSFQNRNATYYLNLFTAILAASGQNKSGAALTVADLVKPFARVYETAFSTPQAFIARHGTVIQPAKNKPFDLEDAIRNATMQHAQNRQATNLAIDEFRAWIQEMIPANEATKYGQLFCRLIENRTIECETATQGIRVWGDPCVNLIGFTVVDPWNAEMRNAQYQTAGIAARIIPVNRAQCDVINWTAERVERETALDVLRCIDARPWTGWSAALPDAK